VNLAKVLSDKKRERSMYLSTNPRQFSSALILAVGVSPGGIITFNAARTSPLSSSSFSPSLAAMEKGIGNRQGFWDACPQ
jgi:hypothetical protein